MNRSAALPDPSVPTLSPAVPETAPSPAMPSSAMSSSAMPATGPTRALALATLAALIALGLAWELWLAPTGRGTLALKVLPLLAALPGLLRNRLYTFRWLSLLVWLYFLEGAVRAYSDRGAGAPLAMAEVALSLLLFAACAAHVRLTLRRAKSAKETA